LRSEPRPFLVHVAVDAVIAFCATVFLLWLFGVELWVMIVVAWVLGLVAAPFTRRWEQRQLDERKAANS
jgi:membrane protein implicated in regulation of membrane protease activity